MKRPSSDKPELLRWLQMQGDADRRILAQLWALPSDSDVAALAAALTEPQRVQAQWERLGKDEQAALTRVLQEGGSLPAAILEREWGVIREPARFANPRAYLQVLGTPATPAERLYSMAFLVRDHDDRGQIFRVLNDLRPLLPPVAPRDRTLRVLAVEQPTQVSRDALDQTERTVLVLLRLADEGALKTLEDGALNKASLVQIAKLCQAGSKLQGVRREADWPWIAILRAIAQESGLLLRTTDGLLHAGPEAASWLNAPRAERVRRLLQGWVGAHVNELKLFGGLTWRSEPWSLRLPASRQTILQLLATIPVGTWFAVEDVVAEVERVEPDFLRRDGRYDNALIYNFHGEPLVGRAAWLQVEGEFVHLVLLGPLHWLGLIDVEGGDEVHAFCLTAIAGHLLHGLAEPPEPPSRPLRVQGTFEVFCPKDAPLLAQYQIARIAELAGDDGVAIYRLTRRSILTALENGMTVGEVLQMLETFGREPVPQAVARYINEWAGHIGELRLEEVALLRADDPIHLLEVRRDKGTTLPPIEELAPTAWKVALGDAPALLTQLQRAGFSVEHETDTHAATALPASLSEHDLKALVIAAHVYTRICADLQLPCEISAAMLTRLRKLTPSRHIVAAQQAADAIGERVLASMADGSAPVGRE